MKLSVLIPTVPERRSLLSRLLYVIERQLEEDVEVLIYNGLSPMGDKYSHMFQIAKGEFIICIDDDDLITDDYFHRVLPRLNGVDFLGYKILALSDDRYWFEISHSYEYKGSDWKVENGRSFRGLSPKCPLRTEIAKQFTFANNQEGDLKFIQAIESSNLIRNFDFIDKTLYTYDFRSTGTIGTFSTSMQFIRNINQQKDVGLYPYTESKFIWL